MAFTSCVSDGVKKFIDYNEPVIALKNALVIDGRDGPPIPGQTLIIQDGKIQWLGDNTKAVIPNEAQIIDLNGKAMIPGLVMLHEHMYIYH